MKLFLEAISKVLERCHREERSDVAISVFYGKRRLPRQKTSRNDYLLFLRWLLVIALFFSLTFISCEEDKTINTAGRISFINLEGGFFGIYGDDGNKYDPVNLPTEFQKDSLRVIFEGTILTGQSSTHLWGKLFEIKRIELLR